MNQILPPHTIKKEGERSIKIEIVGAKSGLDSPKSLKPLIATLVIEDESIN